MQPAERNLAKELSGLATEVDSLTKALARARHELEQERGRSGKFERETVDLSAALAQARKRAKAAESELARTVPELDVAKQSADVREHELRTRLDEATQTIERLRHEVESKERQRQALQTDLNELMGNLRHAALEAGWPARAEPEPPVEDSATLAETVHNGW